MRRQEQQSALDAFRERGSRQGIKIPTQGGPVNPQGIPRMSSGGTGGPTGDARVPQMGMAGQPGHLSPLGKIPLGAGAGSMPGLKTGLDGSAAPASDLASRFK